MAAAARSPWYEHASRTLAGAGYRRGGARQAVLELLDGQPCALSALEIEDTLRHKPQGPRVVSRASVYRILDELTTLGLLARLEVGQGIVRFEAVRGGHGHHHHLICDRCGAVTPFSDDELEQAIRHVAERVPLAVSDHEVILHGACGRCARPA